MKSIRRRKFITLAILPLISCGGGESSSPASAPGATNTVDNMPPSVQFPSMEEFREGLQGVLFEFDSIDNDGDQRTHTITGPDAEFFALNEATADGVRATIGFSVIQSQDFENPADANSDGIYEITVSVDDGQAIDSIDSELTLQNRSPFIGSVERATISMGLIEPTQILGYIDAQFLSLIHI